jgi:hypothetical protein
VWWARALVKNQFTGSSKTAGAGMVFGLYRLNGDKPAQMAIPLQMESDFLNSWSLQ